VGARLELRSLPPPRSGRIREESAMEGVSDITADDLKATAEQLRSAGSVKSTPCDRASALARAVKRWRDPAFPQRRAAIDRIARSSAFSPELVGASLHALLAPFKLYALQSIAERERFSPPKVVGLIMAGNAAGAGLHEIVLALIAGAAVLIKPASSEPLFFTEFARTIADSDPALGARIAVRHWDRTRDDLTGALIDACDAIAAYGDDATIAALSRAPNLVGYPSRVSAAAVELENLDSVTRINVARALARDVTLFEQLGCLSPHHVFVLDSDTQHARQFASDLADSLKSLAIAVPAPPTLALEDSAAVRRVREIARWRRIAGESVELWEGPRLDWTVIYDPSASFTVSPGFRTVYVSTAQNPRDLEERLAPATGRLEAFAIAEGDSVRFNLRETATSLGAYYICEAGTMQSPPIDWRHGGGAFLNLMRGEK